MMAVSLYTSRIVLNTLGASDFGLYNVVGGIVTLFAFINATMATSTQRFLNFEKGTNNVLKLQKIFGTSLYIHTIIATAVFIFAETFGLWFLNAKLNIPGDRMVAANWVFQFSVLTFVASITTVPYYAAIIANEKMSAFAYISILEVVLKLVIVYCLQLFLFDKLILYAILMFAVTFIIRMIYKGYSKKQFAECQSKMTRDKELFKMMMSFSSWTVLSSLSIVLKNQGISIILNLFFGTVVNAAQGIAVQINNTVSGFAANFTQAVNPQIVKRYAAGETDSMTKLMLYSSKFAFFLILLISLPIIIETDAILKLWLKNVPEFTIIFVRLVLILSLVESFSSPLATAQGATGKVKTYHLTLSSLGLLNLPVSFALLHFGFQPYYTLLVSIVISSIIGIARVLFLRKSIGLSLRLFGRDVFLRAALVLLISLPIPLYLHSYMSRSLSHSFLICFVTGVMVILSVYFFGVRKDERLAFVRGIKNKLNRKATKNSLVS